jgi:hypothetical protein
MNLLMTKILLRRCNQVMSCVAAIFNRSSFESNDSGNDFDSK